MDKMGNDTITKKKNSGTGRIKTRDLTKMGLLVALLCVSAYISIPIGTIPITLQTMIIFLVALLLTPAQAFLTVLVYLLLGACGLPVFSGGRGGVGILFGATGGFLFGFLLAAPLVSFLVRKAYQMITVQHLNGVPIRNGVPMRKHATLILSILITVVVGMPMIYLLGTLYMKFFLGLTLKATLVMAVLPFIPLDIIKCIVASLLAIPIKSALSRLDN